MDLLRDKRMRPIIIVVVAFFVILLVVWLTSNIGGLSGELSYEAFENKVSDAAESYFDDNEDKLPKVLDEEAEVDIDDLVDDGYLKSIDKYLGEDSSCSGKAVVRYTNVGHAYHSYLDCGSDYETPLFKDTLIKTVVTEGGGLYKLSQYNEGSEGEAYVFRGELVNNYVQIGEDVWFVVKVDNSGDIMI